MNILLQEQAKKIWQSLEDINHTTFNKLTENREYIEKYHKSFPSSLTAILQDIEPA